MFNDPLLYIPFLFHFCLAVSLHESAHAYMAYRMGDETARARGRLTLNPLAHLDPVGTICLFFAGVGWGKPVPVDPRNLRNPRRDGLWISAAGPASNFLLAGLFAGGLWVLSVLSVPMLGRGLVGWVFISGILLNLALGFFNLLPIFPLDGEKVIVGLIPGRWVGAAVWFRKYGIVILLVLLVSRPVLGISVFGWLFDWVVYPVYHFVVPSTFEGYR